MIFFAVTVTRSGAIEGLSGKWEWTRGLVLRVILLPDEMASSMASFKDLFGLKSLIDIAFLVIGDAL